MARLREPDLPFSVPAVRLTPAEVAELRDIAAAMPVEGQHGARGCPTPEQSARLRAMAGVPSYHRDFMDDPEFWEFPYGGVTPPYAPYGDTFGDFVVWAVTHYRARAAQPPMPVVPGSGHAGYEAWVAQSTKERHDWVRQAMARYV